MNPPLLKECRVKALVKGWKQGNIWRMLMNCKEIDDESSTCEEGDDCTYACDKACSLHSLMSLMRLLYLEESKQSSDSLILVGSTVVFHYCFFFRYCFTTGVCKASWQHTLLV